jgi:hypothetical protein
VPVVLLTVPSVTFAVSPYSSVTMVAIQQVFILLGFSLTWFVKWELLDCDVFDLSSCWIEPGIWMGVTEEW